MTELERLVLRADDVVNWVLGAPLRIVGIVVVALLLRWLAHRALSRLVQRVVSSRLSERLSESRRGRVVAEVGGLLSSERRRQRAETLGSVLRSVASAVILGLAFVMVLGELGVQLGPILASAGVAGVALGFGAQTLVRDFLSGIFLIVEDQYGVGDLVDTGSATGTVEEIGLRVTRLRDANGVVWYVRNGEILRVGNISQGWSTALVDVTVAYDEDLPRVQALIQAAADALCDEEEWRDTVLEDPTVAGVESITGNAVTIRVLVKTRPNEHWALQRELRERIKVAFDRERVRVPPPVPFVTTPTAAPVDDPGGPT